MEIEITTYFSNQFKRDFVIKKGQAAPVRMRQFINAEELSEKLRERLVEGGTSLPSKIFHMYQNGRVEQTWENCNAISATDAGTFWDFGKRSAAWLFIWDHYEEPEAQITAADFERLFWATDAARLEDERLTKEKADAERLAVAESKSERLEVALSVARSVVDDLQSTLAEIKKINDQGGPGSRRKVRELCQRGQ